MSLAKQINQAYSDLGLGPGASLNEIKRAYRRLAKSLHPDLHPGTQSLLMSKVNRAYKTLIDFMGQEAAGSELTLSQAFSLVQEHFKKAAAYSWRPGAGPVPMLGDQQAGWRLVCLMRRGGRVVYQVEVSGRPLGFTLPVRCQKTCRQCEGTGIYEGHYQRSRCPACRGKGRITRADKVMVTLPDGWKPGDTIQVPACGTTSRGIWVELVSPNSAKGA
jgi:molecular chaperone DnaJ